MSSRIDVRGPIRDILAHAERKFDAAIDELVPPTPEDRLARQQPVAVGLAHLVHAWQKGIEDFLHAYAATIEQLRKGIKQ